METLQRAGNRTVEPIMLDSFVLDGEAVRNLAGTYHIDSLRGWKKHFADTAKRLPTVREYIIAFKQSMKKGNEPALQGLLQDLRESGLCAGKINYSNSNIPVEKGYLDTLLKDSAWKNALQDEVFQYDAPEAVDVLQTASGKRPYIWTPGAEGRKSHPERAVWLDIDTGRFSLLCVIDPVSGLGRARGVREVGAAGARAKKSGSAYRSPTKSPEKRLDERIREILSPYEQLKCSGTATLYNDITEEAVREFKELYKKQ